MSAPQPALRSRCLAPGDGCTAGSGIESPPAGPAAFVYQEGGGSAIAFRVPMWARFGVTLETRASVALELSCASQDLGVKRHAQGFPRETMGPRESSSDQLPLDILMRLELA